MDIPPHTGIRFSVDQVTAMNYSLSLHTVRINPVLVGDCNLLNLTWFRPLAPAPGVEQVAMEMAKNQVTVTGTMDIKTLPEKLRRPVDVVSPNKQQQQQDGKDKDNKQQQDGKDTDAAAKALTAEMEAWKAAFYDQQAPQGTELMLSDENPNACSVM